MIDRFIINRNNIIIIKKDTSIYVKKHNYKYLIKLKMFIQNKI